MALLEKARVEVYLPDLPINSYQDLLEAFEDEFTYTFGGCSVLHGLDGKYLSNAGLIIPDRINVVYTDLPFALTTNLESIARYTDKLKQVAFEALQEEAILIAVTQIFHAV